MYLQVNISGVFQGKIGDDRGSELKIENSAVFTAGMSFKKKCKNVEQWALISG